ncbi:hypothetical protein TcasGA2_TC014687 [Tribolium castaneum]|uniref:Carboxylic ester hydrolase n=2 Tax=Tribolium castaneum TaxID=7070 RepID=D6WNV1_TRICA|nr:PREDICTED: esterase FE4 isoform X1 [Tribolium castaneum]EFA04389.1 hypothetical protein TcasGA2_TC014687 [Tribolium castaneum]|eukprot:XP_008194206.1 PREDICTED: esterase FE4 isoform X1 [Tribolium castaneum]
MKFILLVLFNLVSTFANQDLNPEISTPLGKIQGSTLVSRLNETIFAFRGVRYAQPPIGDLRFKPPVPVNKWSGVYNATSDGPVCPQPTDDPVSEDCLLLNVYTTELPDNDNKPKRPVIVYLHPGGFYSVTGRSDWAGPQYFTDHDIVLVTFNYRLGSLGFISTGEDAPGNNGLKDQVLALKWVKNYIEYFGGDPDMVTLFGYSAGSWSITLHLVSPMSSGLFHKAIIGSGSVLGQWKLPRNQLELAKKQARLVGCPVLNPKDMIACLKSIPAEVLGNSLDGFDEFSYDPVIVWYPVIEDGFGQERFLTEDPIKMFERGDFQKVPIVIGVTKDEFGNRAFPILLNATLTNELSNDFETYAPICFLYERETNKSKEISAALREFYLGNDPLTNSSLQGIADAFADSIIGFAANRAARLISLKNSEPVYYYEFTYQGRFSHFYLPDSNNTIPYGVVHHDDLIYLFYISAMFPFFDDSYPESEMVDKLTLMWSTFAKTGYPIPETGTILAGINWEPFNISSNKYLEIGKEIVLKEGLYQERYNFWNELFPIRKLCF